MQDAFERVLHWVENSNKPSAQINRQALTDFIQHELDAVESETPAPVTADQATLVHAKVRKKERKKEIYRERERGKMSYRFGYQSY